MCLAGGLALAFYTSWKLTLVTASAVPAMVIGAIIDNQFMYGVAHRHGAGAEAAGQIAAESIGACRTIFAFNLQHSQVQRYGSGRDRPRLRHRGAQSAVGPPVGAGEQRGRLPFLFLSESVPHHFYAAPLPLP